MEEKEVLKTTVMGDFENEKIVNKTMWFFLNMHE